MSRLPEIADADLTREQRRLRDAIVNGPRGAVAAKGGPFGVWLHSPAFGEQVQGFGAYVRYGTNLSPRRSELAILVCARHWMAKFEWATHAPLAARAGVPAAVIEAIRVGAQPHLEDAADQALFTFSEALLRHGRVSDEAYGAVLAVLGEAPLVELVGLLGYYSLVALTLNAFEVEAPPGAPDFPA